MEKPHLIVDQMGLQWAWVDLNYRPNAYQQLSDRSWALVGAEAGRFRLFCARECERALVGDVTGCVTGHGASVVVACARSHEPSEERLPIRRVPIHDDELPRGASLLHDLVSLDDLVELEDLSDRHDGVTALDLP